ncbi:type I pullulanase [Jeotgalibacillus sp. R-1-5s-1]|uniref:type I pullulanase n=1 Tax=Jeotgalibacillus sp. R-1-5s-1 TaxID=2555897 RepID=UPI00106D7053|nr:type I pullulanase [Jeotgalibacillus sp. R-1-5s-1]TFE02503.1 type I pullulanase [Jeotgalibacillus sp. R-1-5s-1]
MVIIHQNEDFSPDRKPGNLHREVTITLHYHRYDHDYDGWNLWVWLEGQKGKMVEFSSQDSYGKKAVFTMEDPAGIKRVGFIIRKSTEENDWASKRFDDRFISSFNKEGQAEVWLMQGMEKIYTHINDITVYPSILSAKLNKWHEICVRTNLAFDWDHDNIAVNLEGATIKEIRVNKDHEASDLAHHLTIVTNEKLSLSQRYRVAISHFGYCDVSYGDIVRTKPFDRRFYYDGFLGSFYTPEKTSFAFWSPSAHKATLVVYQNRKTKEPNLYQMNKGSNGTWHFDLDGDWHEARYLFRVKIGKEWFEAVDPYAKAVTVNGTRGVVLDMGKTNPYHWNRTKPALTSPTDAIIYELHIRDASIHEESGILQKGKYLGLAELGTATPDGFSTGLDYIADLGVTHVQLLPFFDYWTVDETMLDTPQYNWGYDPKHFNAPEGSYSTDPYDPALRIKELKTLIQAIHDRGMRVIMDVVYNHVYDVNRSPFHLLMPGYFFRYTKDGLSNGTGVGNDTASERAMMQRYMIDSVVYWAKEYHIDGFRFDLMGIHDVETMNEIRLALDDVDPSIIILGEGWDLQTSLSGNKKANQENAYKMPGIAHFNDSLRDDLKGSNFSDQDNGFVNGRPGYRHRMLQGISAGMKVPYDRKSFVSPAQVVNYVEAHDNHTLWDKLQLTNPGSSGIERRKMHKLATSIVLLSQGIPFLHAGQEFMRTKQGVHNSYRSPDSINQLDWFRREEFNQDIEFVKGLISLRKSARVFRMRSMEEIMQNMHIYPTDDHFIAYKLNGDQHSPYREYIVIHNAHVHPVPFHLEKNGSWHLLIDGERAGREPLSIVRSDLVEVPGLSTCVVALPFNPGS